MIQESSVVRLLTARSSSQSVESPVDSDRRDRDRFDPRTRVARTLP